MFDKPASFCTTNLDVIESPISSILIYIASKSLNSTIVISIAQDKKICSITIELPMCKCTRQGTQRQKLDVTIPQKV